MKDAKYLLAYALPLSAYLGLYYGGIWSAAAFYVAFIFLPTYELFSKGSPDNDNTIDEKNRSSLKFFDVLLWLNVPLLYGLIFYLFQQISNGQISGYEILMSILSVGIVAGASGINVAHELGHRHNKFEQTLSKMLLLPELYMHFFIEHNHGHHKKVATPDDPATSRKGETIYSFWFRSVVGGWLSAWEIENKRLEKRGIKTLSLQNDMIKFLVIQTLYLGVVLTFWGLKMVPVALSVAIVGFILLESVNYIEHYGLMRKKLKNGKYESVMPCHSWNSDHDLGRIFLYELTRHSDHHYKSTRKYQVLRHFDESPQLPYGYPGSILLSLLPPVWFKVMDTKLKSLECEV